MPMSMPAPPQGANLPPRPELPRGAIVALASGGFASALSMRVADPLLPLMAREFDRPLGTVALVVTMFALAYGVAQLFFGPVGDRFGKYRVIGLGAMANVVSALACALAPGFEVLVAARLLAGATAAAMIPLAMAWIGDVVPYEQRQPVLARFLIGQIMGMTSGFLLGGIAADHLGWRAPFLIIATLFVLVALALAVMLRRLPPQARQAARDTRFSLTGLVGEFRQVLARPWARRVLATVFLEGLFVFGASTFMAAHLHQRFGLSLSAAGAVVMLWGFGGLLFAFIAGPLVRRLGETGLSVGGAVLMSASLVGVGLTPVWWGAAPACLAGGLGFYMLHNTLQINATQMAPERRGAAVSSFASSLFLGQAVGVALGGLLILRVGAAGLIVLGGVGVLLVGLNFARWRWAHGVAGAAAAR